MFDPSNIVTWLNEIEIKLIIRYYSLRIHWQMRFRWLQKIKKKKKKGSKIDSYIHETIMKITTSFVTRIDTSRRTEGGLGGGGGTRGVR